MIFVDRRDEVEAFFRDIANTRGRKKAVILRSRQGIGKSSLTRKIATKVTDQLILRVECSFSSGRAQMSGKHYNAFMAALKRLYDKREIPSLLEFLKRRPKVVLERLSKAFVQQASKWDPASRVLVDISEHISGLVDGDLKDLFSWRNNEAQVQIRKYLEEAFKGKSLLLIVENFHAADAQFIDFIYDLMDKIDSVYAIFEFTDDVDAPVSPEVYREELLAREIQAEIIVLGRLGTDYALEIVSSRDEQLLTVIGQYYDKSDGNLRPLQDLSDKKSELVRSELINLLEDGDSLEKVTVNEFRNLNQSEQMLLALITAHDGEAPVVWLREAFEFTPYSQQKFSGIQRNLVSAKFVVVSEEQCRLADDVGLRALERSGLLARYEIIALEAWRRIYTESHNIGGRGSIPPDERLLRLAQILNRLDDQAGLLMIVDDVMEAARQSGTPFIYIDPILKWQLRERPSAAWKSATIKIVDSFLDLGMYESALRSLKRLQASQYWSIDARLRFAFALLKSGQPGLALDETSAMRDEYAEAVSGGLGALLALIDVMARFYKSEFSNAFKLFQQLEDEKRLENPVLQALIGRSSIMFFECDRTIPILRSCLSILNEANAHVSASRVQLALAAELGKTGALEEAEALLSDAEQKLINVASNRIVIMNNREAAKLMVGRSSDETVDVLDELLSVLSQPYEEATVLNNLLVAQTLLGHKSEAELLVDRLVSFFTAGPAIDDQNLWATRKNIAFASDRFGGKPESRLMALRTPRLGSIPKHAVCRAIDERRSPATPELEALFSRPHRPIFLYYWGFELSDLDLAALAPEGRA